MRVLIAEHDWALGAFLARGLGEDGHEVMLVANDERLFEAARTNPPELAIIDLEAPATDGFRLLCDLRALAEEMAIVALTRREDADARLRLLEAGTDEVVEKPLSFAELRARCRGLLRRRAPGTVLRYGGIEVNRVERSVMRQGETIPLTNREYALLEFLLQRRGQAVSRRTLLERVWHRSAGVETNVVDVYVNYLRRKIEGGTGTPVIQTVRGEGYTIAAEA